MATTARTRKTAAKSTPPEPDTPKAAGGTSLDGPAAPEAAPLEPPHVDEAPTAPASAPYATPTEVIPDDQHMADTIVDDATGRPPADPGTVFVPVTPFGSTLQCTVRLVEQTHLGPHRTPITRLLQPQGAMVSESIASRIRDRLEDQAARDGGR
ncbi:hypothetical protein ACIQCR_17105 [Streptomyces sp. NPDC093249]|uniref:hypothetical protein n=1 Tax=unclassified Streptomyces TaxID=2593676 RepID=UPI00344B61AD